MDCPRRGCDGRVVSSVSNDVSHRTMVWAVGGVECEECGGLVLFNIETEVVETDDEPHVA